MTYFLRTSMMAMDFYILKSLFWGNIIKFEVDSNFCASILLFFSQLIVRYYKDSTSRFLISS